MRISVASPKAKVVLDASTIAACRGDALHDNSVQWSYMKSYAANCCIHTTMNCSDHPLAPHLGGTASSPLFDNSGTASNAMGFSNPWFQDDGIIELAHGEYPETLTPISDTPCSIFQTGHLHRGLRPEQDDAGQIENFWPVPNVGAVLSAGLSSRVFATPYIPAGVTHGYNVCITEEDAEREVRVGRKGYATRWTKGSVLRYVICAETFPSPRLAALLAREVATATLMWRNIGVSFKQVGRDEQATFAIKYCFEPDSCRRDVCARAFFPKTSPGELFVYQLALRPDNVRFLANILAHELGHILGLYHEFAAESFLLGQENDRSIMKYYSDLSQLRVGQQDREELKTYYECDEGQHEGIFITDIEPRLYQFPKNDEHGIVDAAQRQRNNVSTDYVFANFHPLYCAFALFASLICCGFILG